MKKSFLYLTALIGLCFAFVGCASFDTAGASSLIVQHATLKFIEQADPADRIERAKTIVKHASAAKSYMDLRQKPLSEIEELIRERINWADLDRADTLLLNALIETIGNRVRGDSSASGEKHMYATGSKALSWIIDGAKLAGG